MSTLFSLVISLFIGSSLLVPQPVNADTIIVRTQANTLTTYQLRFRYTPPATLPVTSAPPIQSTPTGSTPSTGSGQVTTPQISSTTPSQTSYEAQLEQAIFDKINIQRQKNGLAALVQDTKLAAIARAHSADMIAKNYFSHNDLNGCSPGCRLNKAGYSYSSWGENIYSMSGYSLSPSAAADMVVKGWMNSAGHRANILNSTFTNQGIGVAMSGSTIKVAQDFTKPR